MINTAGAFLDVSVVDQNSLTAELDMWISLGSSQITTDLDVNIQGTIPIALPVDVVIAEPVDLESQLDMIVLPAGHLMSGLDLRVVDAWDYGDDMSRSDATVTLDQDGSTLVGVIKGVPRTFQWARPGGRTEFGFALNYWVVPENRLAILVGGRAMFQTLLGVQRAGVDFTRAVVSIVRTVRPVERVTDDEGVIDVTPPVDRYDTMTSTIARPDSFWAPIDEVELFDLWSFALQEFTAVL